MPSTSVILEPIAEPKTTKYKDVDITGETTLCNSVLIVRDISNK